MILYIIGHLMIFGGCFLSVPFLVGMIYGESTAYSYLICSIVCLLAGLLITRYKPEDYTIYLKEGCIVTALSWILLSIVGAIPLYVSKEIPDFLDAFFEVVSGFTTTGASILDDVECLSKAALFWRSFTHWIGGMGVLVFLLAIIPISGGGSINIMKAESPGPSVGKFVPRLKETARILYIIYFCMTAIMFVMLLFGGIGVFESALLSLATAGTGGFGFLGDSVASFSPYVKWVITVFMILFGVNFNAYYLLIFRRSIKALKFEEGMLYAAIIITSITTITLSNLSLYGSIFDNLTDSSFQVASLISSTGFCTCDFDAWGNLSKTVLVFCMFVGACAGSTGGGLKISRVLIMLKSARKNIKTYVQPKLVQKIKIDDKTISDEMVNSVNAYFAIFTIIFVGSLLLISFEGLDFTTNFTAVLATINNIGPGLSKVGPACNFSVYGPFAKCVLIFDMLAGRLEFFPLLVLLQPNNLMELFRVNHKK